jgi:hypothetical protein
MIVEAHSASESIYGVEGMDVKFRLVVGGREIGSDCECTLVLDHNGEYSAFGELAHWLDGRTVDRLREIYSENESGLQACLREIEIVCSEAAAKAEL